MHFYVSFADGREPWIVYHAMQTPDAGWLGRTARAQKFGWNPDNSPDFGRPRGFGILLDIPSAIFDNSGSGSWTASQSITSIMLLFTLTKVL